MRGEWLDDKLLYNGLALWIDFKMTAFGSVGGLRLQQ
jgi:hypothetical protein